MRSVGDGGRNMTQQVDVVEARDRKPVRYRPATRWHSNKARRHSRRRQENRVEFGARSINCTTALTPPQSRLRFGDMSWFFRHPNS